MASPELSIFTLSDGCKLAFRRTGPAHGIPVVLLNGILMSMQSWEKQQVFLSKKHPCLLHDFRGQLKSDKKFPESFDMKRHASDLKELLDELEMEKVHLIGTSYGGEVALLFARMFPEKMSSLSVIASVSYSDALLRRQVQLWRDLAGLDPGLSYDSIIGLAYSGPFMDACSDFLEERKAGFIQLPTEFFKAFQRLCEAFLDFEIPKAELARISCPALILAAGSDILKPPHYSRHIASALRHVQYEEISDAGHAVVVEQARTVNRLLDDFLAAQE